MTRDERQLQIVNKWIKASYIAGFEGITGFGKTRVAMLAIEESNSKDVIIVVPQISLKIQWEKELKLRKLKAKVIVVNSIYKTKSKCDLLILDEVHMVGAAEQFSMCWKNTEFNKLLWITATFERKDGNHKELLAIAPKIDSVTFKEALDNGWISDYKIFNIGLELTEIEKVNYRNIEDKLDYIFTEVAKIEKWEKEYVKTNMFNLSKRYIKGSNKKLLIHGINYNKAINMRKTLLYNAQAKKDKTLWFLKKSKLNKKETIIFSQTQEFADYIYNEFKSETEVIHSKMKDKDRIEALKRFNDGRTKKRILSTIKAFNQGINIPKLEFAINAGFTSSKIDAVQKLGRICRMQEGKEAVFVNLYIKGTQEVFWLRNALWDFDKSKIKWI